MFLIKNKTRVYFYFHLIAYWNWNGADRIMEVDAEGLPFLRLPHPHTNIIITLPRYSDGEEVLIAFNDPRVYMNLANPPFPYTLPDWEWAFERFSSTSNRALDELIKVEAARQTISTSETEKWVGSAMPMISIREVNSANGEQRFIGNINVRRGDFMTTVDPDERKRLADANQAMEAGDERIEWELGCKCSTFARNSDTSF